MIRHDRIGDDIETFNRAVEVLADALTMESEYTKESDNMSANTSESKRHYIADEELGGVEREYTETDRRAVVGDYIVGNSGAIYEVNNVSDSGTVFGEISVVAHRGDYKTLSPTDIIRHNGERYRMVDRKADVGESILIVDEYMSGGKYSEGDVLKVDGVGSSGVYVNSAKTKIGPNNSGYISYGEYIVLEPVIDERETDAPSDSQPDSTPDLIDLVIRLTRKVAELEKDTDAAIDGAANALSTANNADFKAGQALTTAELQQERVEMHSDSIELLTDDIITLDERMGAEEEKSKMITHVLGISRRCCR